VSDAPPPASRNRTLLLVAIGVGGLLLCLGSIPVIGIVAAVAIPNFIAMQMKAKRAEVPGNVDGIATAQLAYDAAFDTFIPVSSREEAEAELRRGGREPRAWKGGGAWGTLGWQPDGPVRGAYWVEVVEGELGVFGICDIDTDGDFAEYRWSTESGTRQVTPTYVY
jgi:type II secretory pathway pseudopilin PulG